MSKAIDRQDKTIIAWDELVKLRQADFELTVLKLAIKRVAMTDPKVHATLAAAQAQIDSELPF
jgi:hypothetical protein